METTSEAGSAPFRALGLTSEGLPFPNRDHSVCQNRYRESRENQKWHQKTRISYRSRDSFEISILEDSSLFQFLSQIHTTLTVWD